MPTQKIIDEAVDQERAISNQLCAMENRRGVLPDQLFKSLEHAQEELQGYIMEWLPEWLPGISCITYFHQNPEDKNRIMGNERFFWDCMRLIPARCSGWAEVGLKKQYTKTDALLLGESFELFITMDERVACSDNGHTRHKLVRTSDIWGALCDIMAYHKEECIVNNRAIGNIPLNNIGNDIKTCFDGGYTFHSLKEPEVVASVVAQILLFGAINYAV